MSCHKNDDVMLPVMDLKKGAATSWNKKQQKRNNHQVIPLERGSKT